MAGRLHWGKMRLTGALLLPLLLLAQDPAAEGMKALDAGDYAGAVKAFLRADAADYTTHFHLGLAYSLLVKDAEAAASYRKCLELKPGLYEAELNLGVVLLRQNQNAEALALLKTAAEKKPQEFRPRYYHAEALRESGRFGEAEAEYRAAIALDPKSAGAQLGMGRALSRLNRVDDTAAAYREAVRLDPSYREVLFELAAIMEGAGRKKEAIELYAQFPDNATARERRGLLEMESGDAAAAVASLEEAVKRNPDASNLYALATAYLRNRQPDRSVPLLEKAITLEPDNVDLRMTYGRLLRDQRKYEPAARQFAAVAKVRPKSQEAWSELAAMLILLEQYAPALGALDQLQALGVTNPAQDYFRALIYDRTRQPKPALEHYRKFLSAAGGKFPDEEFKARQRARILERELSKK